MTGLFINNSVVCAKCGWTAETKLIEKRLGGFLHIAVRCSNPNCEQHDDSYVLPTIPCEAE